METTLLVRLKPYDPRRRFVLRRYAYKGIHFHEERGWYRVSSAVAEYLRLVRQVEFDAYSPPAFDVCTDQEAKALEARELELAGRRRSPTEAVAFSAARDEGGAVTTADLKAGPSDIDDDEEPARPRSRAKNEGKK
jgi:hypothetical protein